MSSQDVSYFFAYLLTLLQLTWLDVAKISKQDLIFDDAHHQILILFEEFMPENLQATLIAQSFFRSILEQLLEQIFNSITQ